MTTWTTIPDTGKSSKKLWKHYLGEKCPHGLRIVLVNGSYVRNQYDSDFDQGGNGYRYTFIPKSEIWVDNHVPNAEILFVAFHECLEIEQMQKGKDYDYAHKIAKRQEDRLRRIYRPGE